MSNHINVNSLLSYCQWNLLHMFHTSSLPAAEIPPFLVSIYCEIYPGSAESVTLWYISVVLLMQLEL